MNPGPSIVAALISMSGHGPAVTTVYVPHPPPIAKKNRSRWNGGSARLVTHHSYLSPHRGSLPVKLPGGGRIYRGTYVPTSDQLQTLLSN